jgi:hypothetical protein
MPKLSLNNARDLLRRRRLARKLGNNEEVDQIDKDINKAVRSGGWPIIRTDSASSDQNPRAGGLKAQPPIRRPPPSKWE